MSNVENENILSKNERCQQFIITYEEWLSNHSNKEDYTLEDIIPFIDMFYKSEIADYNYMENHTLIENKNIEDLTRDEILTSLTFYVRGENFSDDFLKNHIKGGTIDKLIKCLNERTK